MKLFIAGLFSVIVDLCRSWLLSCGIVLALTVVGCDRPSGPPARRVILITIDTLRADHLSCYGYQAQTSPSLDRFIERGVRFNHAFSTSPRTAPSHASMLTGRYPSFHSIGVTNGSFVLSEDMVTLAELARKAGLRTSAVVSNFVLNRRLGLAQGFESYDDEFPDREKGRGLPEQTAEHAVAKALAELDDLGDQAFLAWFHFQDPHGPYEPPAEWVGKAGPPAACVPLDRTLPFGRSQSGFRQIPLYQVAGGVHRVGDFVQRYDGEIAYLDDCLGQLFDRIVESGMLEDTLVIITADHGEALGEDEFYFCHGQSVGLDQTRVPLAFVGAGIPAGRVLDGPVSNLTIFATTLNALGIDEAARIEQSDTLLPSLLAGEEPANREGFCVSTTQRGLFGPGLYFRRDIDELRRKVPDPSKMVLRAGLDFVPIGEVWSAIGGGDVDDRQLGAIRKTLDKYAIGADLAMRHFASLQNAAPPLSADDEEKLRQLGYLGPGH